MIIPRPITSGPMTPLQGNTFSYIAVFSLFVISEHLFQSVDTWEESLVESDDQDAAAPGDHGRGGCANLVSQETHQKGT